MERLEMLFLDDVFYPTIQTSNHMLNCASPPPTPGGFHSQVERAYFTPHDASMTPVRPYPSAPGPLCHTTLPGDTAATRFFHPSPPNNSLLSAPHFHRLNTCLPRPPPAVQCNSATHTYSLGKNSLCNMTWAPHEVRVDDDGSSGAGKSRGEPLAPSYDLVPS